MTAIGHGLLDRPGRPISLASLLTGLSLLVVVALGGCSGGPGARAETPGRFEPTILENGTKLFTYTIDLAPRPRPAPDQLGSGERPIRIDNLLDAVLTENGYCRNGWLIIDHHQTLRQVRARGECKEAASAADRERYLK